MTRTRKAGRKSKARKGVIKLASGLGSRGVREVGRGVGRVVGYVPIVGKPGRKVINVGSRIIMRSRRFVQMLNHFIVSIPNIIFI